MNLPILSRQISPLLFWGILSFCSFCMLSCSDEVDSPSSSPKLAFKPSILNSWEPLTRGGSTTVTPNDKVMPLTTAEGKLLYLHTLYTDSIATSTEETTDESVLLTRGTPMTSESGLTSFGISAYAYTNTWNGTQTPDYMYDMAVTKSGTVWSPAGTYFWPGNSYKMRFYAYTPKGNTNYHISSHYSPGSPSFECTIPNDAQDQKDFLVAESGELPGNQNNAAPLRFKHALTAVRFVCGDDMQRGTIKSISLINIQSQGTFTFERNAWIYSNQINTYKQTLNKPVQGHKDENITDDFQTFMMLPQRFTSQTPEAKIEIVFNDGNSDHTLTASLLGSEWPMGKTVTYKISTSSLNWNYMLDIEKPSDFGYYGGTNTYKVASYKVNSRGDKEPIAWSAQYSEDGGNTWTSNRPSWLTSFTDKGAGSGTPITYDATVHPQTCVDTSPHTGALRQALPKGTESNPWNLSNLSGGTTVQETANCYVVNAAGYYSFPLVYGNAIVGGNPNSSVFNTVSSGRIPIIKNSYNHLGNPITDPYIAYNTGCAPDRAELLWQDAPELVINVKHVTGNNGGMITFKVDPTTIREGNAVIAIKDANNNILWSWQIWVTDINLSKTKKVTNHQNMTYSLMPVPIGWCDANNIVYASRSCKVKFISGKLEKIIVLNQNEVNYSYGENCSLYQWGRKDPFIQGYNNSTKQSENKRWYDKNGILSTNSPRVENFLTDIECIKSGISKPEIFNGNDAMDGDNCNLWDMDKKNYDRDDKPVIKTIYDPSPIGFHVPGPNTFTGFTTTGVISMRGTEINGIWNATLNGYDFYCDPTKKETVFFHCTGTRLGATGLGTKDDGTGNYWTSGPSNEFGFNNRAYALSFDRSNNRTSPYDYQFRGECNAVCPVHD